MAEAEGETTKRKEKTAGKRLSFVKIGSEACKTPARNPPLGHCAEEHFVARIFQTAQLRYLFAIVDGKATLPKCDFDLQKRTRCEMPEPIPARLQPQQSCLLGLGCRFQLLLQRLALHLRRLCGSLAQAVALAREIKRTGPRNRW